MRRFVVFLTQFDELLLLLLLISAEWDNKKKRRHLHYPHTFELSLSLSHSLLLRSVYVTFSDVVVVAARLLQQNCR